MSSVNQAIIVGRLGKAPELKHTQSGTAHCRLSIATSEKWTDQAGQAHEKTEWHNVVLWKKQAENAAKYLAKGSVVYVQGRIETRSWDDNGQKRYATEIVAEEIKYLSSGKTQVQVETHRQSTNPLRDHAAQGQFGTDDLDNVPF